jgi:hypothetical protein
VIEPRFGFAGEFSNGLAEVWIEGKAGIINRNGEIVVPPMFQRAIPLTSEVLLATEWDSSHQPEGITWRGPDVMKLTNVGLYHIAGHWVRKPELKQVRLFDDEGRGLIWASTDGKLYGLLASTGEWVVEPQYNFVDEFRDERAIVSKRVDGVQLFGAVDDTGRLVVPLLPRVLANWVNGWGISYKDGKQALLDPHGNVIGGRYFDKVEPAKSGDVAKVLVDQHWKGIDRAGHIVDNPGNGRVIASCAEGMRAISIDGKVQITDANRQPTSPYLFEPLGRVPACDQPFAVELNGLWSFVKTDGHLLFGLPSFRIVIDFEAGYAAVADGSKWGIIDTSGRFVLAFDRYLERRDGLYHLVKDGREVWMNVSGEERPAPAMEAQWRPDTLACGHGLRLFDRDGSWGIRDADGTEVIAPRYRALDCFKNGVAWAAVDEQHRWCALGPDGGLRERPSCTIGYYPNDWTHLKPEPLDSDPYESSVLWVRAYLEFGARRRDQPPGFVGFRWGGGTSF